MVGGPGLGEGFGEEALLNLEFRDGTGGPGRRSVLFIIDLMVTFVFTLIFPFCG